MNSTPIWVCSTAVGRARFRRQHRYEGVADSGDARYWHPERDLEDVPRTRIGFPTRPGVLDAARRPFQATGLHVPWYAVYGNHDKHLQGTVAASAELAEIATGGLKLVSPSPDIDPVDVLRRLDEGDVSASRRARRRPPVEVTPDPTEAPSRVATTSRRTWIAAGDRPDMATAPPISPRTRATTPSMPATGSAASSWTPSTRTVAGRGPSTRGNSTGSPRAECGPRPNRRPVQPPPAGSSDQRPHPRGDPSCSRPRAARPAAPPSVRDALGQRPHTPARGDARGARRRESPGSGR